MQKTTKEWENNRIIFGAAKHKQETFPFMVRTSRNPKPKPNSKPNLAGKAYCPNRTVIVKHNTLAGALLWKTHIGHVPKQPWNPWQKALKAQ